MIDIYFNVPCFIVFFLTIMAQLMSYNKFHYMYMINKVLTYQRLKILSFAQTFVTLSTPLLVEDIFVTCTWVSEGWGSETFSNLFLNLINNMKPNSPQTQI